MGVSTDWPAPTSRQSSQLHIQTAKLGYHHCKTQEQGQFERVSFHPRLYLQECTYSLYSNAPLFHGFLYAFSGLYWQD